MSSIKKTITSLLQLSLLAVFLIPSNTLSYESSPVAFTDISIGHPSYVPAQYLKSLSIIEGYPDASFKPDKLVNRAEALTIIMRAFSKPENESTSEIDDNTFNDIPADAWYRYTIEAAYDQEIITGYPDGSFKPSNSVTLAEALAIAQRTIQANSNPPDTNAPLESEPPTEEIAIPFADISEYAWYLPEFQWAEEKTILDISRSNKVYPDEPMSREELAQLIYRILQSDLGYKFGQASYYSDIFEGRGTSSGEPFTQNALTAANQELPFGTMVEVTNLQNGKSVIVKINDRGPWGHPGRKLDLSRSAFETIGSTSSGHITVQYKVIEQ